MPRKMMKIPSPTASARIGSIRSYLDRDHATDDQVANEDHEGADRDQDPADEVLEHRPEVGRGYEIHERGQHDRQGRDQRPGRASLRGERGDLALDADPLADRVVDVVENLGEVSTDRSVDRISGGYQVEVCAGDSLGDVRECFIRRAA